MQRLAGPVYQAGTLSGNPIATAAGLATLRACTDDVYVHLDRVAAELGSQVEAALEREGVAHRLQRAGNLFSVFSPTSAWTTTTRRGARRHFSMQRSSRDAVPRRLLAAVGVRGLVRLRGTRDAALDQAVAALPHAARAAASAALPC